MGIIKDVQSLILRNRQIWGEKHIHEIINSSYYFVYIIIIMSDTVNKCKTKKKIFRSTQGFLKLFVLWVIGVYQVLRNIYNFEYLCFLQKAMCVYIYFYSTDYFYCDSDGTCNCWNHKPHML